MNAPLQVMEPVKAGEIMEAVIAKGDLAQLRPDERAKYYTRVCESIGLNPLTKPFEYITLNGKLTLYARKDCTDQLRSIYGVSVTELTETERDGVFVVTAKVANAAGRTDMAKGAVNLGGLKGEALANALMKAETKAKRRATLSICGLGFLDETEVETPDARTRRPEPTKIPELPDDTPPEWRPSWHGLPLAKQADILCADGSFWKFLMERSETEEIVDTPGRALVVVRRLCGVSTLTDIRAGLPSGKMWQGIVDDYRDWQREDSEQIPYVVSSSAVAPSATEASASETTPPSPEADAISDATELLKEWDDKLAQAAEQGTSVLAKEWAEVPASLKRLLAGSKDRRHKPRAMEVDAS